MVKDFEIYRGKETEGGVETGAVVKGFDVVEDASSGVEGRGERVVVKAFGFEGGKEAFDAGIVVRICSATHAGNEAVGEEAVAVLGAGVLAPAVTVMKQAGGRFSMVKSHEQGGNREGSMETVSKGPADNTAAVKVQNDGEKEPAISGFQISNIDSPNLIGTGGRSRAQGEMVGGDRPVVSALGSLRTKAATLTSAQSRQAHEAAHAALAVFATALVEGVSEAGTSVSLPALGKSMPQLCLQLGILALAAARRAPTPVIVTAPRHSQQRAEQSHGMSGRQCLNLLISCAHGLERMPSDFFKISRCSVTRFNSAFNRRFSASNSSTVLGLAGGTPVSLPSPIHPRNVQ
jgi:hypothetical protein